MKLLLTQLNELPVMPDSSSRAVEGELLRSDTGEGVDAWTSRYVSEPSCDACERTPV